MKQGKISDYVNPVPIKITDDKAIFKVEKLVPTPYIERVLPLEYAPLYEQLAELDTAIPKIVCLEKSDRLTVIEEYIDSPRLDQYLETHKLTSCPDPRLNLPAAGRPRGPAPADTADHSPGHQAGEYFL
ncbi:hypothetical protein LOB40_06110 [Lactobacillus delbrueckii subsp. lactis]|nr:hypothetical protein [Lactobacillus delbrueckii]MCD5440517.1 hypothetical protein [Lactobacillus delbrueckii subsp. lactis]